jgi:hypothetical protein
MTDTTYPVLQFAESPPLVPRVPATTHDSGGWMQTYTGGPFWPLDPRHSEIRFDDIAGSLSKLCRFNGHCVRFYSVAEHCVHVAKAAPVGLQLTALMHDASEAYLADVPRPIKPHLPGYYKIEDALSAVIAQRFDLVHPLPPEIKRLDTAALGAERAQNMAHMDVPPALWGDVEPPLPGMVLQFWDPARAKYEFATAFYRYGGRA